MQPLPCASLLWVALLLAPSLVFADTFETFYLDPTRSTMEFQSGDLLNSQLSIFNFASAPLTAQPGGGATSLAGEFVLQIGNDPTSPTFFDVLSGTSTIRAADANGVSPGSGGAAGTTDAAFGVSFLDPTFGISGDVALHDVVLAASGFLSVLPNGQGPFGLAGGLPWTLGAGTLEIATSLGIGGTTFVPFTASASSSVDSSASQFSEIAPGVYEVVMPYTFLIGISPIAGPFTGTTVRARFAGEIVATNVIPEPGTGALLGLGLTFLSLRRRKGGSR